jgi:hypothetical protein
MSNSVIIPIKIEATEFWSAIFGSAWESWDWWLDYEFLEGSDWDTVGLVRVVGLDPEGDQVSDKIEKILTIEDLVKSYTHLVNSNPNIPTMSYGELDLDASDGDVIIQQAIFGDVIYG